MAVRSICRIGIVGAGTMGRRIAFSCVTAGKPTALYDISSTAADQACEAVVRLIAEHVERGRLPSDAVERASTVLSVAPSLERCVADADLVVETVPECVETKREVFAAIDQVAPVRALIGSNTSSIPPSWLADATRRPQHVFNFNFGTPDNPKVEVMGHGRTAPDILDAVEAFLRELGLVPIRIDQEVPGYVGNRIWRAVKKEALFLIDRGHATPEDIDRCWMLDWGTPIGPCGLMDKVGLDVVCDIEQIYYRVSGDPSDQPPPILRQLVAQGKLGVKSGQGFYTYPNPAYLQAGWLTGEATESLKLPVPAEDV